MEDRNLSLSAVAGSLGVSERTVRRWIKSGKLKAYKPGRDYRIPESALRELVEESEISPKAESSSLEPSLFNGVEDERREKAEAAYETAYNCHVVLGETLAEEWQAALEKWDKKLPPGEAELGSVDLVQGLLDWVLQTGRTLCAYETVGELAYPNRPELRNTIERMQEVHSAAEKKFARIFERVKTRVEFREIVKNFERLEGVELDVR